MKAAVITFPGSNCDDDTIFTLSETLGMKVENLWHKDQPDLKGFDLVVLPGGFSYGDYLRCGAVASLSPIMGEVIKYANQGGLTLGICNGFQVLCETRLLPGALATNKSTNFICRDVDLRIENKDNPWTNNLEVGDEISLHIAHTDGRYVVTEDEYKSLSENGQVLLTYKQNPNGSQHDIAGVCNKDKNVFGLMPHPERATHLRSGHGHSIWKSVKQWIEKSA